MTRSTRALAAIFAVALAACQRAEAPAPAADAGADAAAEAPRLFDGLGDHSHPITTDSDLAQRYFDQGLALTFAFNHDAAIESFRAAARLDPECAMCFWGIAFAWGPNINAPMGPEGARAGWEALQEAQRRTPDASAEEREYIDALAKRYSADPDADRAALDRAFADAMRGLSERHPSDLDAATLYAESLMDLMPWDYYTPEGEPREHTPEVIRVLESVLARDPKHIGANHYLIHALEEHDPARAEAAADRLASLAPDAGHLVHMPFHIYWRLGRYRDAADVNERAANADVAYFAWCRAPQFYAAAYYNHNLHSLWASVAAQGQSDLALTTARRLASNLPAEEVPTYPFLEDYWPIPILTLARFGRWDAILAEPKPPDPLRYATAIWHYARGLALARLGRPDDAQAEYAELEKAANDAELGKVVFDSANGTAGERLRVALHQLRGELATARGDLDAGTAALEEAVWVQDSMNYIEPPAWYFPVRQALGAVLLQAGRAEEAEAVYRKDLEQYPKNGWSLFGLAQALRAQDKREEASWAETGFANAWSRADVKLAASRF
jgi:tetratricopeptide (TPR) repeat protein